MNATVKETLRKLIKKNGGHITPQIVLDEARRKTSPLHSHFTWDDNEAAQRWRLNEAAHLIRRVRVTVEVAPDVKVKVRAFMNVSAEEPESDEDDKPAPSRGVYVTMENAMNHHRDEVLSRALSELNAIKSRYAHLKELASVWEALSKV